eukprot:COSAG02_NODE_6878_length_3312_cov_12.371304_1_plen_71_part_00
MRLLLPACQPGHCFVVPYMHHSVESAAQHAHTHASYSSLSSSCVSRGGSRTGPHACVASLLPPPLLERQR